ncbi:MAG: class I SAM-dependent methyltransferase [Asgard group archaeon]
MNARSLKKHYLESLYPFEKRLSDEFHALHEKVRFDLILSAAKIKSIDVTLDAGCGTGFLSIEAAKKGAYVVGLDVSKPNLHMLRRKTKIKNLTNLNIVLGDIEKLPFKIETFTFIICTETLEHIINIDNALSELRMVLRKAGGTIITVPNILWIWRWLLPLRKKDYYLLIHKPWKVFSYYRKKWKNLLNGLLNGFTKENENWNSLFHCIFGSKYFKHLISKYFKIEDSKSTFKGFYWTLPLIPISIQRKIAMALNTNTSILRNFGVQLLVLGKKEHT